VSSLRGSLYLAAARVLSALPEPPLAAAAESIGELWYRTAPERAAQARANLGRVCEGLAAGGHGTALARRAATDPEALELLVRRCFRHAVRYYLEVARTGSVDQATALDRIDIATPDTVRDATSGRGIVLVGMHFGALELPVAVVSRLAGHRVTTPMETLDDPALRRWFETSRGRMGVQIVPLRDARRTLLSTLREGRSIGLVNDRDITRTGIPVPLFGAPAPISPAPAVLALETGAPVYVASARRIRSGRYVGRLIHVPVPESGSRRERVVALTTAIAGAFETLIGDAPEQWWGAMHPIWPDLVPDGEDRAAE
jgi:KDO2-lipid IV(A) lauroyltransferase